MTEEETMRKYAEAHGCPVDYPQAHEKNEYRYLSPAWLDEIAKGLTAGQEKYPGETWRKIPAKEHAWRAAQLDTVRKLIQDTGNDPEWYEVERMSRGQVARLIDRLRDELERGESERRYIARLIDDMEG